MERTVDVAIVGGGMVGASLAIALARACPQLRIVVLEAVEMPDSGLEPLFQPSYDARSTALSHGTRRIYERLGLWRKLSEHLTPIQHIHVSDRGHFGTVRLHAADYRLSALGYVVENQWLGRVLWAELKRCANVDFRCPVTVESVCETARGVAVKFRSAQGSGEIQASLAVLADGGRSKLRQQLGIQLQTTEYAQAALIANVSSDRHHEFVAYERFTDVGPMALLPLGESNTQDKRCALVWTLPTATAEELARADERAFLGALQERFGNRLGNFVQAGSRQLYPLVLERSLEQVRPGLVLIGNAAHILHPVAGQGYNLALREVMGLAAQLTQAVKNREAPGSFAVLKAFESEQFLDQERTVRFSDSLVRVFSNRRLSWVAARGLGLIAMELMPPLKETFARYAMGMGGREAVLG